MSYPDNATASIAQFLFRDSAGAMYIIPRRAFHNGAEYGDTVTLVQDLSGNGHDLTGTAIFDRRSFYGTPTLDNVRDAQFIRDVNMSAPVSGTGTTIRAAPGGAVMFDEGALDGTITGEFSVLILIDRTLSEREKHVVSELARLWGGANWTPGALFADGQDGVWLDPSDHSTLWIDEARTQNATQPGDVVWWIDDKSGNENHFSVDASANRSRLVRWPASAVREGYVRNRLTDTDNISFATVGATIHDGYAQSADGRWDISLITADSGALISPLGSNTCQAGHNDPSAPDEFAVSFEFKSAGLDRVSLVASSSSNLSSGQVRVTVSLTDGEVVSTLGGAVQAESELVEEGFWRVKLSMPRPALNSHFGIRPSNSEAIEGDGVKGILYRRPQQEAGLAVTDYQAVGAGHWDVTEEGQPDCWGIEANGINNRYVSERGIPEYVDGKVRMLVGQTKQRPDRTRSGILISSNPDSVSGNNVFCIFAHLGGSSSYMARYRSSEGLDVPTGGAYPSPHTGILDQYIDSWVAINRFRVNDDSALTNTGRSGTINSSTPMSLLEAAGFHYEGILWGLTLTAYAPDETLWDRVARDWLNSTNMPGVLSDDD